MLMVSVCTCNSKINMRGSKKVLSEESKFDYAF